MQSDEKLFPPIWRAPDELPKAFNDWRLLVNRLDDFAAPNGRIKRFCTLIAQRA
jgi:hypothetical protein